ncbi:MAG: ABC transporter ATP-binding protein [Synergistaceae bacterium]|jgi:lipopolysaccharide transport system ATP-binding protein|nr:ABC transporter ATP-binding protein [Synergistaceae bacterium]
MPDTVIQVENLGKKYRLTHKQPQTYIALRDVLVDRTRRLARRLFARPAGEQTTPRVVEDFWALSDISFEVRRGERVGVVGRNGVGKSTLLKILSRITEPTIGRVRLKGRVSSLLEVGTGFHPELTGRENIFLNGAILGMSKAEIKKNFDAIVDFAGVERFLDTPVKRYSSGMYVRLAFAVAAHLETEILLVDEVLAVGDADFQKKCLGKMDEVSHKEGRTILFVSHSMPMITSLCESGLWLEGGKLRDKGPISSLVVKYSNHGKIGTCALQFAPGEYGDDEAELVSVSVENAQGVSSEKFEITEPIFIKMRYRVKKDGVPVNAASHIHNASGVHVLTTFDTAGDFDGSKKSEKGEYISSCRVPPNFLNDGYYSISPALSTLSPLNCHFTAFHVLNFLVVDSMESTPTRGIFRGPIAGLIRPVLEWNCQKVTLL